MKHWFKSLLKITKLDAGSIVIEKSMESVADMMRDVELHLHIGPDRNRRKSFCLDQRIFTLCDRDWLIEAIDNIVKMRSTIQQMRRQFALNGKLYPMPVKSL